MEQKCLRVCQIDAAKLDSEIYNILCRTVQDTFKYLPPGYIGTSMEELNLLLKVLMQYYSIYQTNSTFGQKLMSIKYASLSNRQKIAYIIMQNVNYAMARLSSFTFAENYKHLFDGFEMLGKLCSFINFSIFLKTGSKPLLVERLLGLEQVHLRNTMQRTLQSKYLARELLWNGFIEILIFILPLINYHKARRIVWSTFSSKSDKTHYHLDRRKSMSLDTLCAHCNDSPILPHHMGCNHVFCYTCLKGNQMADPGYECPLCGFRNVNSICNSVKMSS